MPLPSQVATWLIVLATATVVSQAAHAQTPRALLADVARQCGLPGKATVRELTAPEYAARMRVDVPHVPDTALPSVFYSRRLRELWLRLPLAGAPTADQVQAAATEVALALIDKKFPDRARRRPTPEPLTAADAVRAAELLREGAALACGLEIRWAHEGKLAPHWNAEWRWPDHAGLVAVGAIRMSRPWRDVWARLRRPPTTTEQLLHGEGEAPLVLAPPTLPPRDASVRRRGAGELAVRELLISMGLTGARAASVAAGWHGAAVDTWLTSNGAVAHVILLAWDQRADSDEACEALSHWVGAGVRDGNIFRADGESVNAVQCGLQATRVLWQVPTAEADREFTPPL